MRRRRRAERASMWWWCRSSRYSHRSRSRRSHSHRPSADLPNRARLATSGEATSARSSRGRGGVPWRGRACCASRHSARRAARTPSAAQSPTRAATSRRRAPRRGAPEVAVSWDFYSSFSLQYVGFLHTSIPFLFWARIGTPLTHPKPLPRDEESQHDLSISVRRECAYTRTHARTQTHVRRAFRSNKNISSRSVPIRHLERLPTFPPWREKKKSTGERPMPRSPICLATPLPPFLSPASSRTKPERCCRGGRRGAHVLRVTTRTAHSSAARDRAAACPLLLLRAHACAHSVDQHE